MLATVASLHVRATDDALDLFDVLMATKLFSKASQSSDKERLRRFPRLATASSQLARAVEILLSYVAAKPNAPLEEVWRKIQDAVGRDDLESAVLQVGELTPRPGSDFDETWRSELVKKFGTVRRFLVLLAEVVELKATAEGAPVLAAMCRLPGLFGRKKVFPDEIDIGLLRGSWRRIVLLEDGTVDWKKAYTLCVLERFHRSLVASGCSRRPLPQMERPAARELLSGERWLEAKPQLLVSLDLPDHPDDHLTDLTRLLDETYREVVGRLSDRVFQLASTTRGACISGSSRPKRTYRVWSNSRALHRQDAPARGPPRSSSRGCRVGPATPRRSHPSPAEDLVWETLRCRSLHSWSLRPATPV